MHLVLVDADDDLISTRVERHAHLIHKWRFKRVESNLLRTIDVKPIVVIYDYYGVYYVTHDVPLFPTPMDGAF